MKIKNLQVFPSTTEEVGKPFERVDPELLDRLNDIQEEYTKNAKKPIEPYEDKLKSLIGETLNLATKTDRRKLFAKKNKQKVSIKKRSRSRNKQLEKDVKNELKL